MGHYGLYSHYWDLDFWKSVIYMKLNLAQGCLYGIALGICKMSIIFLYQRIFDTTKTLKRVLWGTHIFNILLALSYPLAAIFVWRPLNCHFMVDVDEKCVKNDVWDGSGANAAVNAALDLWLVILPAVMIWKLQIKISDKLSLIGIFAAGLL